LIVKALDRAEISEASQMRDRQASLRREMTELRDRLARLTPRNPFVIGFKVFVQTDEDGMFQDTFGRLPSNNKTFMPLLKTE
jgi:hypothetical protein